MTRQPLYEVSKEAYLFPGLSIREGDQVQHEEKVRQWCAYELIRAYGIRIDEIEFERQVRIGSKLYRIDIMVTRNSRPWIVVECKRRDFSKPEEGMAQAISYANQTDVQAPFAVYTNGDLWHVQRKVAGQWIPTPDLPACADDRTGEPLTEILRALNDLAPILHNLDEALERLAAKKFLEAMQSFFAGGNILTDGIHRDLLWGTDNLLRVVSHEDDDSHYRSSKLADAHGYLESYRRKASLPGLLPPPHPSANVAENCQYLSSALSRLINGAEGTGGLNYLLLRLDVSLAEYGMKQSEKSLFPPLTKSLHRALGDFLNASLRIHMNTQLPDYDDRIAIGDMRRYCHPTWEAIDRR